MPREHARRVHQSAFYKRTPGHQPLLIDHWLLEGDPSSSDPTNHQAIINANLNYQVANPLSFLAQRSDKSRSIKNGHSRCSTPTRKERKHGRSILARSNRTVPPTGSSVATSASFATTATSGRTPPCNSTPASTASWNGPVSRKTRSESNRSLIGTGQESDSEGMNQ